MRRGMVLLAGLALIGALVAAGPVGARPSRPSWQPKARGELDCNGYSKVQAPVAHFQCVEFRGKDGERPEDNGHYVGHDEPGIQFLSNKAGSGNAMSYDVTSDGQHILVTKSKEGEESFQQINVVMNWFDEIKKKVSSEK